MEYVTTLFLQKKSRIGMNMRKAFWPHKNEECTAEKYLAEYGGRHDSRWKFVQRPFGRCPACLEPVKLVGEDRVPLAPVFSHIGSSKVPPPCPLRNSADHKYAFLIEPPQDTMRGRLLRISFFEHWQHHYKQTQRHLKGIANIEDFISMINAADHTGLWYRAQLSEWEIPYIFLVWQDYPPLRGRDGKLKRREWYRFWFNARVRTLEDLWIRTTGQSWIIRATYATPRNGGVPGLKQLKDTSVIRLDDNFLNNDPRDVADYVIERMNAAFPLELGARNI